jgi:tRNA threonylcarbamoyladenosine biosynthesis protein TsaB
MKDKIIILESSGEVCSVAIADMGSVLSSANIYTGNAHDRLMADYIRRLLTDLSLSMEDIGYIAVSAGPGSFTGLRIGASLAKGLCFGRDMKFIGIPTLEAIAHYALGIYPGAFNIVAAVPSHKTFIYYQEFNENGMAKDEPFFKDINEVMEEVPKDSMFCGPGWRLANLTNIRIERLNSEVLFGSVVSKIQKGEFTDPAEFTPLYIQDFVPKSGKESK